MWRKSNRRRISHLFSNLKKRETDNDIGNGDSSNSSEEYDSLAMNERGSFQTLESTPEDESEEQYQRYRREKYGSLRSVDSESPSKNYGMSSDNDMDSLPLPIALRPLVKRLRASNEVSDEEMVSILFIVRLVDALHRVAYATFLTQSFMDELRKKLRVPDLDMEIEVNAIRWSYNQGAIMTYHRIAWDYDGDAMQVLSRIALGVMENVITPLEGLTLIEDCEDESVGFGLWEQFYRTFPGRAFVVPILSACGSVLYFNGTFVDLLFGVLTGGIAGAIHYICALNSRLARVQDLLVSIVTAMISTFAMTLLPNHVCFTAEVLGTLFWFLYGVSFMLSLYEMTNELVMTGLSRFALAILNSFILAFGVVIGVWIASFGGPDRFAKILQQDCSTLDSQVDHRWFLLLYPIVCVGALMQMRVAPEHWPLCLVVQGVAVSSQFLLDTKWHQPTFVVNFLPAHLATLTAHFVIMGANRLQLTELEIAPTAYLKRSFSAQKSMSDINEPVEIVVTTPAAPRDRKSAKSAAPRDQKAMRQSQMVSAKIHYIDDGWADDGLSVDGYVRNERFQYQRSDLWFCLLPALYLLVPGSSVWRIAFFSIMESTKKEDTGIPGAPTGELISGVFVIAIGQVIGVRLGIVTLSIAAEIHRFFYPPTRLGTNRAQSSFSV